MSTLSPQAPWIANRLPVLLLPMSLVLWGTYMALLTAYCVIYQQVVTAEMPDVRGVALWILREWWAWALVTPLIVLGFRRHSARLGLAATYLGVGALALLATLTLKIVQEHLALGLGPAAVVVIYSVRYLATLAVITLVWHVYLRPRSPVKAAATPVEQPVVEQTLQTPQTLLVSKGNDKCLLRVDRIECINAAGNYVEIQSDGQIYLLRATMKQVQTLLPPGQFLRIHRCHIVNLDAIDRIKTRAAGNGSVHLHCGRTLNISRAAHARLKTLA